MERILTGSQMKAADTYTITELGIPSLVLMERAALAVVEEMERAGMDLRRMAVFCGSGNNGGDGFAIARLLKERGFSPEILFTGREERLTEETRIQKQIAEKFGLSPRSSFSPGEYTGIVDAMLGVGLKRDVEGRIAEYVRRINASGLPVTAVDLPTGVCADTGRILGEAVQADLTVTFAWKKAGQIFYPGAACCGQVVCRRIGIAEGGFDAKDTIGAYGDSDLSRLLPRRRAYSNKGTYGKVMIAAGSANICGAAYFSAKAAAFCGSGMVKVLTRPCNREILQIALPQAMLAVYGEGQEPDWESLLGWADVAALGPGMGTDRAAAGLLCGMLRRSAVPLVLDADALTILADGHREWLRECRVPVIVTPHVGEMMRISGWSKEKILDDLPGCARAFARENGVTVVLKDSRTVISDGKQTMVNLSGNHGMACAGSGDVLTGIIASLLGQGLEPFQAASLGAYLHGRAGDLAREEHGAPAMGPEEEICCLGRLLKSLEKEAR